MPVLTPLTQHVSAGRDLSKDEVIIAAAALATAEASDESKEAFLLALATKGESAAEIAAFAEAFRLRAIDPGVGQWSGEAIDVVGTGGDHAGAFNVSSLVTLVLASAGVIVMIRSAIAASSLCSVRFTGRP